MYRIWSFEHDAWWRANERGYTRSLDDAGSYETAEASRIVLAARGNEMAIGIVDDVYPQVILADQITWGTPGDEARPDNCVVPDKDEYDCWRVIWNGRATSPRFNSRGAASAYLAGLFSGSRRPEYPK